MWLILGLLSIGFLMGFVAGGLAVIIGAYLAEVYVRDMK